MGASDPMELADERHNIAHCALDCWCMPTYRVVCDECKGSGLVYDNFPCWKCIGGVIEIGRGAAETFEGNGLIIVHKEDA